jgi:lipoic acid synthetase
MLWENPFTCSDGRVTEISRSARRECGPRSTRRSPPVTDSVRVPPKRLPPWIRSKPLTTGKAIATRHVLQGLGLHTICTSARCPNIGECYAAGTATFLILGNVCTRSCAFCGVPSGSPGTPAPDEPERVAAAVRALGLTHAVVTSVTRDDLADGGASYFRRTTEAIRRANPGCVVELLVPDFRGEVQPLATVLQANPDILGHNVETVSGLHERIRPGAVYRRSLRLLKRARELQSAVVTKSAFMMGLGETAEDVQQTLEDLALVGCQIVCVGQYLRPSRRNPPVRRYVTPDEFDRVRALGERCGIPVIVTGPLVRSSYQAASAYRQAISWSSGVAMAKKELP